MMHPFAPFAAPSVLDAIMAESLHHHKQGTRHHIHDLEHSYKLTLEAPGVRADDLDVTLNEQVLKVVGKSKNARHGIEVSFELPRDADVDNIHATTVDGIVTFTIMKLTPRNPTIIPVSIYLPSDTELSSYMLNITAAGISASDIHVQTCDGMIKVEGKTERTGACIDKVYKLPTDADAESTTASHIDGILTLHVPRKPVRAQKIAVHPPGFMDEEVDLVTTAQQLGSGELGDAAVSTGNGVFVSRFNGDRMEVIDATMTIYAKDSNTVLGQVTNVQVPHFEAKFPWGNVYMVWDGQAWQESGSSNVGGFLANARWEATA